MCAVRAWVRRKARSVGSVSSLVATACLLVGCIARGAGAQRSGTVVFVTVSDSLGVVAEASVSLTPDSTSAAIGGLTGPSGMLVLRAAAGGRQHLVVRRVGYQRFDSTVVLALGDTAAIRVRLRRIGVVLDTVRVLTLETIKARAYHVDAASIAASKRPLFDAFDIISKLRPDIVWGRGNCGGAANIWVNGRWIPPEVARIDDMAAARASGGGPGAHVSRAVLYVLSSIKPEHVAEMTYHDCRDMSIEGVHAVSALFVVLKPGVQFDPGRGSYLPASSVADSARRRE